MRALRIHQSSSVGLAKANEVLMFNKKKNAQELLECGFIKCVCPMFSLTVYDIIPFEQ